MSDITQLKTKNVMIDLETWGTGSNAIPISIGAVKFNLGGPPVDGTSDGFHVGIIPATAMQYAALKPDGDTIMWWLDDEQAEARSHWMRLEKTDIATALTAFIMWLNDTENFVWGNGAAFDNVILRNAFETVLGKGTVPWHHWNDRCYKTMKGLVDVPKPDLSEYGIKHTALADAMFQARHLQLIAGQLGIT